jgi:hypothetical protein
MRPSTGTSINTTSLERLHRYFYNVQTHWKWLGRILTIIALAYVSVILVQNWSHLQQVDWRKYLFVILISFFIYLASLLLQLTIWLRMLSAHHRVGWQDVQIYMRTVMLRQIPGGVWHWLGRSSMYGATTSVSTRYVLLANFIDWCLLMSGAIAAYGVFSKTTHIGIRIFIFLISAGFSVIIANYWFPKRQSKYAVFEGTIWTIIYIVSWFLGGILLFLLIQIEAASPISVSNALIIWIIAGGISGVAIIIPSGLGIRELSLAVLLQPYMSVAQSLLLAIILRFTFTMSDIIWGACGWGIGKIVQQSQKSKNNQTISTEI